MQDSFERGDVVWGTDPFRSGSNPRPWLVLSTERHPFHGEEYVCTLMTTTERESAVRVTQSDWVVGGLSDRWYVSPWVPMTMKHSVIVRGQGSVRDSVVDRVSEAVVYYLAPN
ncbi:hypothetical protein [Halorussus amylolyticus]|uniref:hypothetical protein n=1 Tax=Halorussus amylolyticus TaxID=1126242 RepID=UPI001047AA0D|nr:hypothetical protein [Halorussus amylolyticus]